MLHSQSSQLQTEDNEPIQSWKCEKRKTDIDHRKNGNIFYERKRRNVTTVHVMTLDLVYFFKFLMNAYLILFLACWYLML